MASLTDTMRQSDLLGVELPIIQAPMAGVQLAGLAVAVSNAGGLGSLPCAMLAREAIRRELETIRAGTAKPCNGNFFCHVPPQPEPGANASR
jgi:nitronate monooxygenase